MGETTHTQGPWTVNRDRRGAGKIYVRETRLSEVAGATAGRAVAQVTAVVGFTEQAANAHLIAASPELLEALRFVHEHAFESKWAGDERALDLVEAAIAKAEGRSDG